VFLQSSYYSEKSRQKARPLNIVQSGQNFAHKLIFLCVTRATLWSRVFPTFVFLGHTNVYLCCIIPEVLHWIVKFYILCCAYLSLKGKILQNLMIMHNFVMQILMQHKDLDSSFNSAVFCRLWTSHVVGLWFLLTELSKTHSSGLSKGEDSDSMSGGSSMSLESSPTTSPYQHNRKKIITSNSMAELMAQGGEHEHSSMCFNSTTLEDCASLEGPMCCILWNSFIHSFIHSFI